eukprot:6077798-Pleurochrysis_carterae.AAC.1
MAKAAAGMSVLVATDSAAVAVVDEATPVARITEVGRTAVDVAAGAKDYSRCCVIFRWIALYHQLALVASQVGLALVWRPGTFMRSHICLRIIAARHQTSLRSHPWAGKSASVATSDAQMACALTPSQGATYKSTHALERD